MLSWNTSETTSHKDLCKFEEKSIYTNVINDSVLSDSHCVENFTCCSFIENGEHINNCNFETEKSIHLTKKNGESKQWKNVETEESLTVKLSSVCDNALFPLHPDCLTRCFSFLTFDDIMKAQIVCKYFQSVIQHVLGTFNHCKSLVLNSKWARLPPKKREFYLRQMTQLRRLKVLAEAFMNKGMSIHEVASLVAQNVKTLRSLQLLSPESLLMDSTLKHEPFAFVPLNFPCLMNLSLAGCQVLEWLHIFGNCDFSSLERFEVCHYPLPHDHWSWNISHDFTKQGVAGLHKMLDTMCSLERLTVGFDIWFDSSPKIPPADAFINRRECSLFNNDNNSQKQNDEELLDDIPPVGGFTQYRSYRGKLSEEDFGDIFTIALVRSETSRNLKRVIMKYRIDETNVGDSEQLNPVFDFFEAAASFCGRYVSDVYAKITGINNL